MRYRTIASLAQHWLAIVAEQAIVVTVFLMATGGVFWFVRTAVDLASRQYWILGILATILFLGLVIAAQVILQKALSSARWEKRVWGRTSGEGIGLIQKHLGLSVMLLFGMIVLVAILLMATLSNILHSQTGLLRFTPSPAQGGSSHEIPADELASELLNYYGWHAIDVIPALDVWKSFNVEPPLRSGGPLSGFPEFFFRFIIVAQSIGIIKKWLSRKTRVEPDLATSRC